MHTHGDFWAFSLKVYGQPGVAEACLGLQDRIAADVNLVLFAAWLGSGGRRLQVEEAGAAVEAVIAWQREIVEGLRRLRRRLKVGPAPAPNPHTDALRESVKANELTAEKIEQDTLEAFRNTQMGEAAPQDPVSAAVANVASVLRLTASAAPGEAEAGMIGTIVEAAIPNASRSAVEAAVLQQIPMLRQSG